MASPLFRAVLFLASGCEELNDANEEAPILHIQAASSLDRHDMKQPVLKTRLLICWKVEG